MPLLSLSISQLLLAFVSASILHKLALNRFFLTRLSNYGFLCYLTPTNNELRRLKEKTKDTANGKKGHSSKQKARARKSAANNPSTDATKGAGEFFKIPTANLDSLKLETSQISGLELSYFNYADELEWIVDLALMSLFTLTITEVQFYFFPKSNECNFSLLWALLVIVYCMRTLWNLTALYFKDEKSIGERSTCIVSACVFLLIAMMILTTDEKYLELGLENAYRAFNESATAFVNNHAIPDETRPSTRPISFILVKFSIAILCSLVGALFTFPGLRFGQLHKSILDKASTNSWDHMLLIANYLAPLTVVLFWLRPISRDLITKQELLPIDDDTFDTIRIYFIILTSLLRFYLFPKYAAEFLLSVKNRLTKIKHRGGTTSNLEIRLIVSGMFKFFNIIVLQYILPIFLCLFVAIMFTTMGGHYWLPMSVSSKLELTIQGNSTGFKTDPSISNEDILMMNGTQNFSGSSQDKKSNLSSILSFATMVDLAEIKGIFSTDVFKGIFGFATWWLHFAWFCTSTTGIIYHTYLTH